MTTERLHLGRSVRDLTGLFKQTMPFQSVPKPLLKTLVALSRSVRYEKGQLIYDIGDPAEDLYIVYLGEVAVIFPPGGELENLSRAMRSGSVFGWDALFKNRSIELSYRLGRARVRDEAELMLINADEMENLFDADYAAYRIMMGRFVSMIAHESSMLAAWTGVDT